MKSKNIPALLLLLLVILLIIYFILSKCSGTKALSTTCINAYAIMGTHIASPAQSVDSTAPPKDSTIQPVKANKVESSLAVFLGSNETSGTTGFCSGTGLCTTSLVQTSADEVPVTICSPADNPSVVTISFSMAALKQKQPDHVRYIENKTEYTFGADCILSDTACKKLGYQVNTRIPGKRAGKIKVNADTVVITMPLEKQH